MKGQPSAWPRFLNSPPRAATVQCPKVAPAHTHTSVWGCRSLPGSPALREESSCPPYRASPLPCRGNLLDWSGCWQGSAAEALWLPSAGRLTASPAAVPVGPPGPDSQPSRWWGCPLCRGESVSASQGGPALPLSCPSQPLQGAHGCCPLIIDSRMTIIGPHTSRLNISSAWKAVGEWIVHPGFHPSYQELFSAPGFPCATHSSSSSSSKPPPPIPFQ